MVNEPKNNLYGVEAVVEAIKDVDFPCSKQDLVQKCGDKDIEFVKGRKEKLRDVLQGLPYNTFDSVNDLKHAFYVRQAEENDN